MIMQLTPTQKRAEAARLLKEADEEEGKMWPLHGDTVFLPTIAGILKHDISYAWNYDNKWESLMNFLLSLGLVQKSKEDCQAVLDYLQAIVVNVRRVPLLGDFTVDQTGKPERITFTTYDEAQSFSEIQRKAFEVWRK